jgi:hypothetical protein
MPFVLFLTTFLVFIKHGIKSIRIIFIFRCGWKYCFGWLLKWSIDRPRPPEFITSGQLWRIIPSAHSAYAATLASLMMLFISNINIIISF